MRVLQVLELLGERPLDRLSLSVIARRLEMSKATCHAVVTTLAGTGFLIRDPASRAYGLGPALVRIGRAAEAADPVSASAAPELASLSTALGFRTSAVTRAGDDLVLVATYPRDDVFAASHIGTRLPLVAPMGEVFMAWADTHEIEAWITRGTNTAQRVRASRLRDVLRQIRECGYTVQRVGDQLARSRLAAIVELADGMPTERAQQLAQQLISELDHRDYLDREITDGPQLVSLITAPVRDAAGEVRLSISLWPDQDLTRAEIEFAGAALVAAGERIASVL